MKNILVIVSFLVFANVANAQSSTVSTSIKVFGNCTMCKARIEKVLDHKGIKKAEWSPKTKQLEVVYNSSKITVQQIHQLIASVGHDTEKAKAKDEVYAALPFCCLYRDHDHK
ncbi:MAG: heavy-metal-associated domain-containing protein [Cytophagales bacterium]